MKDVVAIIGLFTLALGITLVVTNPAMVMSLGSESKGVTYYMLPGKSKALLFTASEGDVVNLTVTVYGESGNYTTAVVYVGDVVSGRRIIGPVTVYGKFNTVLYMNKSGDYRVVVKNSAEPNVPKYVDIDVEVVHKRVWRVGEDLGYILTAIGAIMLLVPAAQTLRSR